MRKRTSWLLVATLFWCGTRARAQGPAADQESVRNRQAAGMMSAARTSVQRPATELTLMECYHLAEANYPLTRQRALIEKTRDYSIANVAKGIYPQLDVNGTATYQSTVTSLSFPPSL